MASEGRDIGQEVVERSLRAFSSSTGKLYDEAEKEAYKAIKRFLKRMQKQDDAMLAKVEAGEIETGEWVSWRLSQLGGSEWNALVGEVAETMHIANVEALEVMGGFLPAVYAENYNWGIYLGDRALGSAIRFDLMDERSVRRLAKENPDLLGDYGRKIESVTDIEWNKRKINGVVQSALINGESIPDTAKSMMRVTDMNATSAFRTARTALTACQNGSRLDAFRHYKEATGLDVRKRWMATLDMRTRHTHAISDDEVRDLEDMFSNGCLYPGDPSGEPSEVYNCRCTMVIDIAGIERGYAPRNETYASGESRILGYSYDEWKQYHKEAVE